MECERQCDEFAGKRVAPPEEEECLMWSAGWARGVMMVMEECGMSLRGANPGERAPIERSSPIVLSIAEGGGRKQVWKEIEALLIKVEDGIEEGQFKRRSADR